MLKDVRTAVDRLAQRMDGVEASMGTVSAAALAMFPQEVQAVRAIG
jgi:hypothetical protein